MNRYEIILRHAGLWGLYAVFFFVVNKLGNSQLSIVTAAYSLPLFMLIYYGISYSLNVFLYRRKYLETCFVALMTYSIMFLLLYGTTYGWGNFNGLYRDYFTNRAAFEWRKFMQTYLLLISNFSVFAILNYQYRLRLRANQKEQEQRVRRRRYEYTVLSQQVSPHLLANVFQSLQHQLRNDFPELCEQIMELYQLMRYFMNASLPEGPASVLLADEIHASRRFIRVYDQFFAKESTFLWKVTGNTYGATIPATGLVTLVSNVFKHGDPFDTTAPPVVRVSVNRDGYILAICNRISRRRAVESHGMGLVNLRRRLRYVFGDKFELFHQLSGEIYQIRLTVYF